MARKELFTTIRTEGAILPSDVLQRIGELNQELPGLKPEEYGLAPTERINEAIARSWTRLQGLWVSFRDALAATGEGDAATGLTRDRWLLPLFDELGYGKLKPRKVADDLPVSHIHDEIPIHLLGAGRVNDKRPGVPLDTRTPAVPGAARRSPHGLVQDYLNNRDEALFGVVSNGRTLRLLRDNSSLTRQAYVDFDLEGMFAGEVYPDFRLLWLVCHATRFEGDPPATCFVERWSQAAAQQGARALDRLREGVKQALIALGSGFLRNQHIKDALRSGALTKQDYYRELLRLVYRLLFLFVAEDRNVLHPPAAEPTAVQRYSDHFSTARLRRLAYRHRGGRHPDLWNATQVVLRALGDPEGLLALGLPSLGGLFASNQTPYLDAADIGNHQYLTAVRALAFTPDGRLVRAVDYKNLGPEEFGSVYESLLELHPDVDTEDTGKFGFVEAGGSERKTTGSYYTPPSLVQALLDSALEPVLAKAATAADPEQEILSLRVVDPASGSGHFLIAAAHRIAQHLAAARNEGGSPAPSELRRALRDVVGRCIYGVDVNAMAVELCKVSLWIEAVEPGRPLSFLDQHIRCGNSLVGTTPDLIEAGIPLDAFKPITGDDKEIAKERRTAERKRQHLGVSFSQGIAADRLAQLRTAAERVAGLPDDDAKAVATKADAYQELAESELFQATRAAFDAWCAAFYLPKSDSTPDVGSDTVASLLADHPVGASEREAVTESAKHHRFFHWHLEFPDVMIYGGFDCVLGNPPWEKVKLSEKEFFAVVAPEIANASNKAARSKLIEALRSEDTLLYEEFQRALRSAAAESQFLRTSGRYPLGGRGDVNTYVVFAESMRNLLNARGRVGAIVPTGIATDDTTKYFFSDLVDRNSLVSLHDFQNVDLFPGVGHGVMHFSLLTMRGLSGEISDAEYSFFAKSVADLSHEQRRFTLSRDDFALLNPNTRTCPVFRSGRDAEITKAIYRRLGVLIDKTRPNGNPWDVSFVRLFDMSNDSHLFRERVDLEAEEFERQGNHFIRDDVVWLPLYEGKMIHHFNHRFRDFAMLDPKKEGHNLPDVPPERYEDPAWLPLPRYWVDAREVSKALDDWPHAWLLGWRDIARNTDERTVIATILPRTAVGNKIPLVLPDQPEVLVLALAVALSSLAADYVARQKIGGTTLNYFLFEQLALPSPQFLGANQPWIHEKLPDWLAPRAIELIYTAWDLESFASNLGYDGPPFRWDAERRLLLRAELDAAFFHLYGISREDADYILDTFPISRANDEKRYGFYRTKEVILDLFDRMAKAAETGVAYETILDPPPAHPGIAHPASTRPSWATVAASELAPRPALTLLASPPSGKKHERYVPVMNLKAAAGNFGTAQDVEPEGWFELPDGIKVPKDAFITQVVGRSMEPTIADGSWCLFAPPRGGSRDGKVLLVQHRDIADPETGGSYTIKRYRSEKAVGKDALWSHVRITLEPENPEFESIVLTPESEDEVHVVGEFRMVVA